ncbi:MAG: MBG domain-containing protein, partial [Actinomycetes bacterium]
MSIPKRINRVSLSNFLAILLAISSLQLISIGSAPTASALTWIDIAAPSGGWQATSNWNMIRTNSDGSVIGVGSQGAVSVNNGHFYMSRDSGSTWTLTGTGSVNYGIGSLAVSGDGTKAIAAPVAEQMLRSVFTSGSWSNNKITWTGSDNWKPGVANGRCSFIGPNWESLATSSDGSKWIAGVRDESCVYTSSDYGSTWYGTALGSANYGVAMSSNGSIKMSANADGKLYRYSGSSWSALTSSSLPATPGWWRVACDSTCTKMAAVLNGQGKIFVTLDSGANWSSYGTNLTYTDLSMSEDGSILAATSGTDVFISQNSGSTWAAQSLTGGKTWKSVTVSGDGKKIYAAAYDGTIRTTAILASQTITFNDPSDMTFGDPDQAITATSSSNLSVTLTSSTPLVCSIVSNSIRIVSAGTCTITASQIGNSNYSAANQVSNDVIISKKASTISASGSTSFTYNGLPQGPASSNVTGSTGTVTYSYSGSAPTTYIASATKPTNVGSYVVTATVASDTNYLNATSSSYAFSISKAPLTITASSPTVLFGASVPSITPTFSGLVNSESSSVVTGWTCSTIYTTTSAVGTSPSTSCSGGTASNYTISSYNSGAVTINKATPTLSNFANVSKTYGASTFDLTAPTAATPGTWSYSSGTTSVISISGSSATVVGAGTSVITATFTPDDTTNYNSGGTISMTVTVSKPTISITASSHTVAFGGSVPTITPTYSGFVNGDTASVISGLTCSTSYTTTTSVGTTTSTCAGASASNYSFSYTSGVITITQGDQTTALTINTRSVTYGSTLSLATSGGSGIGSNSFNVDSGPCTISGATLTPTAAGTCMVTATKAANGNYLASSSISTAITVSPKGLTISGLSGSNKEFNGTRLGTATGTPTLVGKVGSDDVLLGGTPTFTFASANVANGISLVASGYTLTGTTAGNYTLTQPTVTANITAKAARVSATNTTVAYGATVTSGFTTSGLISPDAVSSASYTYTGTGTATPPTAVGVYTVTPSNAVFSTGLIGNYTITYDTATVTILAKYTITFNANGGQVSGGSTSSVDFVVGDNALSLPTPTRANYTFTGWYTLQSNGV